MRGTIKWVGDAMFVAESGSGHSVVLDGPPDHGGRNMGLRPMEMVLLGVGGCASFDVVSILKKARQEIVSCHAELEAERAEGVPSPFTKIHMKFVVKGKGLKESQVERAVTLSSEKYCSASIMLAKTAKITHDFEIKDAD